MSEVARHLAWAKGGHAEIVDGNADALVLRSTTSAPPGARLDAMLVAADGAPREGSESSSARGAGSGAEPQGKSIKIKSHGSHREADGSFTLKGRLLDANKELRERISALATRR